ARDRRGLRYAIRGDGQREEQAEDEHGERDETAPVDRRPSFELRHLPEPEVGPGRPENPDRDVHVEQRAPVEDGEDDPADGQSRHGPHPERDLVDPEGEAELLGWGRIDDHRRAVREQDRGSEALHRPERDDLAGLTAMLVRREPNVKTPKPLVYSFTRPVMSETRPIRRSATVLPRTYAWVIQIACSGSAWRLAATCGSPMITMRESRPAMSTPTVVTVRTVHLYWIRIAFHRPTRGDVRSPRGPGRRATKPQEYLNLPNHSTRKRGDPRNLRDADTLDRMMAGDQVPRYPEVSTFLSDRATLLRGLHGHGRMDDVPALLELDALHVEVSEDVRDEPVRLVRVLNHVDVLVHEPLQFRDVLALLPDRLADVPFLHDENQLVGRVDAVDDGRPREILEESDVFDRLFVKDNLDHAASGAEDVRVAGAEHR